MCALVRILPETIFSNLFFTFSDAVKGVSKVFNGIQVWGKPHCGQQLLLQYVLSVGKMTSAHAANNSIIIRIP